MYLCLLFVCISLLMARKHPPSHKVQHGIRRTILVAFSLSHSKTSKVDHLPKLTVFCGPEVWPPVLLLFGVSAS